MDKDCEELDWTELYPDDPLTVAVKAAVNGTPACKAIVTNLTRQKPLARVLAKQAGKQKPLAKVLARRRRTVSSGTDNTNHTTNKGSTMATVTRKPAARKATAKTADSVEVTLVRFREPAGKGGVRYQAEDKDSPVTTIYLAQAEDAAMGSPKTIVVTISAA